MLIVSFCDIVTVTTAAMFFALLITVQESVKIPVLQPTPISSPSKKRPVFFECRSNEVFFVDKVGLDDQVAKVLSAMNTGARGGDIQQFLKMLQGQEVTNEYYRVNPGYLLTAIMALESRPGSRGEPLEQVEQTNGVFRTALTKLDPQDQYIAFLVRDDSFHVFRKARVIADRLGFDIGWEFLSEDEPIKFGAGGVAIPTM